MLYSARFTLHSLFSYGELLKGLFCKKARAVYAELHHRGGAGSYPVQEDLTMARILTLMAVAAIFSFGALGCGKSDPVTKTDIGDKAEPEHPKGEDQPKAEDHPKGEDQPKGEDHPKGEESEG